MMLVGKHKGRLGLAIVSAMLCGGLVVGCQPKKPEDPLAGYRVAIVDLPTLMELDKDYPKLQQLSKEIDDLQAEKVKMQNEARDEIVKKGGDVMQEAVAKARAKLQAEQAQVEGELHALSSSLNAQVAAEMKGVQARLEDELKRTIDGLMPKKPQNSNASQAPATTQAPPIDPRNEGQVQDFIQNLGLVRQRNLAARRLELEKNVGDEIQKEKAKVDGQIADYEAQLSNKYQSERLNLQLTAQNSTDEAAKTAAENRLSEIANEIDTARTAKRQELESGFAKVRSEKMGAMQAELEAYQRKLDAEVAQKVAQKRAELGGGIPKIPQEPVPDKKPTGPPPEVEQEVKAKIAELQARMKAQVASKQAEVEARMKAKIADSRARLEKKQEEIQKQLKAINEKVTADVEKSLASLPKEMKAKFDEIDGKITKLEDERDKLVESIRKDVSDQVAGVAEKKNQKMVLGLTFERNYWYKDPSFEDLTDLASVRMQTSEKK